MSNAKVCIQLMTVKSQVEKLGIYDTFRKLKELGFDRVEVSQFPLNAESVALLKKATADFNMQIVALSAVLEPMMKNSPGKTLKDDFTEIVSYAKELECRFLRMGAIPLRVLGNKEKVISFAREMEDMAERLNAEGMEFYFHNHHYEFQKLQGRYLLDIIKENTKKLGFELDVHWIQRAGEDPVKIIEDYCGRIALLHLKDYRIAPLTVEENEFSDTKTLWEKLNGIIQFAELGEGNLDLKAILEAGVQNGVQYFIIEQDQTYERDSFESLEISAKNLIRLGYKHLF